MLEFIGVSGNVYSCMKKINTSGQSTVYKAICQQTKEKHVIKIIHRGRFYDELKILQRVQKLHSTFLIKLIDYID